MRVSNSWIKRQAESKGATSDVLRQSQPRVEKENIGASGKPTPAGNEGLVFLASPKETLSTNDKAALAVSDAGAALKDLQVVTNGKGEEGHSQGSNTAFSTRKSFWMKFLDEDSPSNASDLSGNTRRTPIGQEIQKTWTNGSPLSEASCFDTPKSVYSDPGNAVESTRDPFRKQTINRPSQSLTKARSQPLGEDRRASTGDIDSSRCHPPFSPGALADTHSRTPESTMSSVKQLGDATNRLANQSMPSQQDKGKILQDVRGDDKGAGNELTEKNDVRNLRVATDLPTNPPMQRFSPTPDAMIEIGGPFKTPSPHVGQVGSMGIVKVSPQSDHQEKFQEAYEAWNSVGLKKGGRNRTAWGGEPGSVASKVHAFTSSPPPTALPSMKRPSTASPLVPATPPKPITQVEQHAPISSPDVKKLGGQAKSTGFENVLKAWKTKSEEKANAKLRSPERSASEERERSPVSSPRSPQPVTSPSGSIDYCQPTRENSGIKQNFSNRIKAFDKDYFDVVREKQAENPPTQAPGLNHSLEEGPVSQLAFHASNSSGLIADSDLYEESFVSFEEPSRALVILENNDTFQIMMGESQDDTDQQLVIKNVELVTSNQQESRLTEYRQCQCAGSIFSGNNDLISFFLPQMGMACSCGKGRGIVNPDEPTAIENILRPWQVEFLKSFGIHLGEQLVKARHRSADVLAKALRQWRRKKGLAPFKTSSCGMAIDIWAKTCKTYVRSIRKQINAGHDLLDERPDDVMNELSHFFNDLPAAPKRRNDPSVLQIIPDSQVEL